MKKQTLSRRLDAALWFVLSLLPLICYFAATFHGGNALPFPEYMVEHFNAPFLVPFVERFSEIGGFGVLPVVSYISYLFVLELTHLMYSVLIWLVRFAQSLLDKWG